MPETTATSMQFGDTSPAPTNGRPTLSIVVPMFNEEDVLHSFFKRLEAELKLIGEPYEIICVNDGSDDSTLALLLEASAADPRIKVLNFSRNFGKEVALTAGLDHSSGRAVVPIDADLQDPPELIKEFVREWQAGHDVVYGIRKSRNEDTWIKKHSALAFYRAINLLAGVTIPKNTGDFRLMDRRVVLAMQKLRERNRFMKGLFAWVGFRQTGIYYDRPVRVAGKTKFTFWKLWNFALDGITGFSTFPLRVAGYVGTITALLSMIYGFWLLVRTLIWGGDVPGYASVMVAVLFMGGTQLIVLGILGEYIGRSYQESKKRPLYVLAGKFGFEEELAAKDLCGSTPLEKV